MSTFISTVPTEEPTRRTNDNPKLVPITEAGHGNHTAILGHASGRKTKSRPHGSQYAIIIGALCVVSSLPALEGTVVSTALPSIMKDLGGGEAYVWVVNAYFLSRSEQCGSTLLCRELTYLAPRSNLFTARPQISSADAGLSSSPSLFSY